MLDVSEFWGADATLVKLGTDLREPQLLYEGSLAAAALKLSGCSRKELVCYRVALPDRPTRPRVFEGLQLIELVAAAIIHKESTILLEFRR